GLVEVLRELHGAGVGSLDLTTCLFEGVVQPVQVRVHLVAVVPAHGSRKERALVGHGADLQCRDVVRRGSGSPLWDAVLYGPSGAQDTWLVRMWIHRPRMQCTDCMEYSRRLSRPPSVPTVQACP